MRRDARRLRGGVVLLRLRPRVRRGGDGDAQPDRERGGQEPGKQGGTEEGHAEASSNDARGPGRRSGGRREATSTYRSRRTRQYPNRSRFLPRTGRSVRKVADLDHVT